MKKSLLLTTIVLLGLPVMHAQDVPKKEAYNPISMEIQRTSTAIQQVSEAVKKCKTTQKKKELYVQKQFSPLAIQKQKTTRVASDVLSGIFILSGESEFNGTTYWPIKIEQDAQNTTKYWITNLVPDATTERIYGMLNGTTLSFPVGQTIVKTDQATAIFSGINENGEIITTGNISAKIDESKHTITFVEGFGTQITSYPSNPANVGKWFDIILPGTKGIAEPYFTPPTSYQEPEGTLNYGLSRDYFSLNQAISIASPYSTWKWTNTTSPFFEGTEWQWNYTDSNNNKITSTNDHLSFDVEVGNYGVPSLTGTYKGNDSTYIWGAAFDYRGKERLILAGGTSIEGDGGRLFDLTNANLDNNFTAWRVSDKAYAYGTGVNSYGWATDELISVYDKPQSTLVFKGVDIYTAYFSAPASTEFKLYIVKIKLDDDGFPIFGDTIATGTTTASAILKQNEQLSCLPFESFVTIDEDGFESEIPYVEVDDQFALVFTGYNQKDINLCVLAEYNEKPGAKHYSFFKYKNPKDGKIYLSSWSDNNTMYMQLHDAAYAYITPNISRIEADTQGGNYDLTLAPLYNSLILDEKTCPDWISITQNDHFDNNNWGSDLQIKVKALPQGVTGRSANIKYVSYGASCIITVNQGITTGISTIEASAIKATVTNENFELTYPVGISNVMILNVSGQTLASYELPTSGKYTISTANLSKGMYLLKFDNNQTIKVIK